jgi:hypothetical protein
MMTLSSKINTEQTQQIKSTNPQKKCNCKSKPSPLQPHLTGKLLTNLKDEDRLAVPFQLLVLANNTNIAAV